MVSFPVRAFIDTICNKNVLLKYNLLLEYDLELIRANSYTTKTFPHDLRTRDEINFDLTSNAIDLSNNYQMSIKSASDKIRE